jgi:hypothetical protein
MTNYFSSKHQVRQHERKAVLRRREVLNLIEKKPKPQLIAPILNPVLKPSDLK